MVLVATSSRPESIDEALRRPGRMDRTITLPKPNKLERETILRRSAKESMDDDLIELVDWKEVLTICVLLCSLYPKTHL